MSDWLTEKGLQKLCSTYEGTVCTKSRECLGCLDCNNEHFLYSESICGFAPHLCLQTF